MRALLLVFLGLGSPELIWRSSKPSRTGKTPPWSESTRKRPGPPPSPSRPRPWLSERPGQSAYFQLLNGDWRFNWVRSPGERPRTSTGGLRRLGVGPDPRALQLGGPGYGVPIYLNHPYEFEKNPPFIHHDYNPVGSYRTTFQIPEDWGDREVFLHFGAVKSAMYLWVNGQQVGYSQGSKLPAEFNVTEYLRPGENLAGGGGLPVERRQLSGMPGFLADQRNRAGRVPLGGPKVHIRDVFVKAGLDDNYRDGRLEVTVGSGQLRIDASEAVGVGGHGGHRSRNRLRHRLPGSS